MYYLKKGIIILSLILGFEAHSSKPFASQEELNAAFATSMVKTYERLNQNWGLPEISESHSFSSSRWEMDYFVADYLELEKVKFPYLTKKNNSLISDDLEDLINSKALTDSALAGKIAHFKALGDLLGEERFNFYVNFCEVENQKIFIGNPTFDICNIMTKEEKNNISCISKEGYFGYIPNHEFYIKVHPSQTGAGEILVTYVDPDDNALKYMGFGPLFKSGGKTLAEVKNYLKERFNEPSANPLVNEIILGWKENEGFFEYGFKRAMQKHEVSYFFDYEDVNELIEGLSKQAD